MVKWMSIFNRMLYFLPLASIWNVSAIHETMSSPENESDMCAFVCFFFFFLIITGDYQQE